MRPFKKLNFAAKLKRIKYWFVNYKRWRISRAISNCLYWLRTHTYNRYHIINIKSPQQGYKWGWLDRDHVLFLAMFRILSDFIEKEVFTYSPIPSIAAIKLGHKRILEQLKKDVDAGARSFEYEMTKISYDNLDKLLDLYRWFNIDYPKLKVPQDGDWDYVYKIESEKMKELIDARAGMWT